MSASRPCRFIPVERASGTYCIGRPQGWSGRYGEKKNSCLQPGHEPRFLGHPARSLFAIPRELSRLQILAS
jgi:hypothetical protein